jgi:hypothetical protein
VVVRGVEGALVVVVGARLQPGPANRSAERQPP